MARRSGSITARGERKWLVRWYVSTDANGKRKYSAKTVHGKKRDAQKFLNSMLRSQDLGEYVEPAKITLDEFLDRWLETAAKPKVATRTYEDYRYILERYVRPVLGIRRLDSLRPLDAQKLIGELEERGLSPRTVRIAHGIFKSALAQAVRWQMLARNPAADVDLPKGRKTEMRALSCDEVARFRKAAKGSRRAVLFDFALATGMRPSEYLALAWRDVDLDAGTATVRRAIARVRGGWELKDTKTRSSRRTIPLPGSLIAALREHRRDQAERILRIGPAYARDLDLVFANEVGQPLDRIGLSRLQFKPILQSAGLLREIRLYDLRHTCCSLALQAGIPVRVVSERLGHASAAMTLDVYAHVLPGMQEEATAKLEAVLFGGNS